MKFVTINTTSYNKDCIIGVDMPTREISEDGDPTGKWFFVVYVKDAIEEIVDFDTAEECIKARSELMTQLENNYYEEVSLATNEVYELTGCMDGEDLLKSLKELKNKYALNDKYTFMDEECDLPLVEQIDNCLEALKVYQAFTEKFAQALVDVENKAQENRTQEIIDMIKELPLDEYRT